LIVTDVSPIQGDTIAQLIAQKCPARCRPNNLRRFQLRQVLNPTR